MQVGLNTIHQRMLRHFTQWHNLMELDQKLKVKNSVRQQDKVNRVFQALKLHSELGKKAAMLHRIRLVTLVVKAF